MNKRILTLAKKNFMEKFIGFYPNTQMPGLPKNHFLRILVLLLTYVITGLISFAISQALGLLMKEEIISHSDYFTYSAIIITLFLIIYSTYEIISDFYTAKDTEILLSLPLKNDEIFLGKLMGNIASDIDYLIFFAIILMVYFSKASFDMVRLLMGVISFISLIVITYCIICLIIMVVMRFTNARKYKGLFKFIGYGLGLLAFGLYFYFIFSSNNFTDLELDMAVDAFNNARGVLLKVFYPASLFGKAIGDSNYMAFGGLLALGIISFLVVKFVASKIYLDSIIEKEAGGIKKKKKRRALAFKSSSQTMAIAKKELSSILKTPVFLYQSALMVVMVVAILLSAGKNLDVKAIIADLDPDMKKKVPAIFFGGGLLIASFLFSNNVTSFTSLSREGKSFYLTQTLPIDPSSNLMGRFLGLYAINFLAGFMLTVVFAIVLDLSLIQSLAFLVGISLGAVFSVFFGLFWGTKKIYTSWTKPAEMNKTGGIGFLMFFVSIIINAAIYGLAFGIYKLSYSITLAMVELIIGIVIASVIYYLFGVERYRQGFFDVK